MTKLSQIRQETHPYPGGSEKPKILLTGAAGHIGQLVIDQLADRYDLVLTDCRPLPQPSTLPFAQVDIADLNALRSLCQDIDIVFHLAAANMHASWDALLLSNIVGVYNILQAAQEADCRRVILTSSIQVVDGAAPELTLSSDHRPQPSTLYGTTKAWSEIIGSYFASKHDLSVICLRLGRVAPRSSRELWPGNPALRRMLTHDDLIVLLIAAIEAPPDLKFATVNGLSNNRHKRLDINDTQRLLGYAPQDDAFALAQSNYPTLCHRWLRRARWAVGRTYRSASRLIGRLTMLFS